MAEFDFDATKKHYKYTPKSNPKDLVEVEIGDAMDATAFFPQVKIKRWDNEINASLRLKHDFITGKVSYSDDGTKITWKKGQWKAVFYDRPDASNEGGFEFEIHIPKKPPINYLDFTVNTKQLDWFYQPALTQEEIAEGAQRPDNVVGSFAVYYKDCPANYVGGKEYKVGKAYQLYAPEIKDANGNTIKGEWSLTMNPDGETGNLRLTCPQSFLDSAVYPVVVDPTFGYSGTGNSSTSLVNRKKFSKFNLSESGTVTKLTASLYKDASTGTVKVKAAIFDDDSPYSINGNGGENTITTVHPSYAWWDFTLLSGGELTADDWWLGLWGNSGASLEWPYVRYDDTSGTVYWKGVTYVSGTDDWTYEQDSYFQGILSIYATYTAGGGGTTRVPRHGFIHFNVPAVA